ncbi:phage major tail tube protein, partial [Kingella denitrificans]
ADGREMLYYNAFTNTYRVNGTDVLAQYRRNVGA